MVVFANNVSSNTNTNTNANTNTKPTQVNEYPWMVAFANKAADEQGGCGATLVCIRINTIPVNMDLEKGV